MQAGKQEQLKQLLADSEKMLELAEQKMWDDVARLELQRQEYIKDFFLIPVEAEDSEEVADVINRILSINQQLVEIFTNGKVELQQEFSNFKSLQQAQSAYLNNML